MSYASDERSHWLGRHVLPHEGALRAWLRGKAPLGVDVDDVVQETYAILAAKADVEAIRNVRTYTFQVAYSVVLQQLRRAAVVPIRAVADISALETMIDAPSSEDTVLHRQELDRVRRAIAAMPRQTRQAFTLRRIDGLSQRDIARRMALSEHTVEKHIARGIKLLLAEFGRGGNDASRASRVEKGPAKRDLPKAGGENHRKTSR